MSSSKLVLLAGVDEAGRGPLAGPVIAAAVILDNNINIEGLADSKTISPGKREKLANEIIQKSLSWAIARADVDEIDRINILQASLLAMKRCVSALSVKPGHVLVDGNICPDLDIPVEAIIKGDATVPSISAASIIAKVFRDREMIELDKKFPAYGFATHKGYPTKSHINALELHGASPVHRKSFSPVRNILLSGKR